MIDTVFLAGRQVGSYVGTVWATLGVGLCRLEVGLQDAGVWQRLVLPHHAYAELVTVVHRATTLAASMSDTSRLPCLDGGLPILAHAAVPGWGELFAVTGGESVERVVTVEIIHGTFVNERFILADNSRTPQELFVDAAVLPELFALLDDARLGLVRVESERRGVLGHA